MFVLIFINVSIGDREYLTIAQLLTMHDTAIAMTLEFIKQTLISVMGIHEYKFTCVLKQFKTYSETLIINCAI